MTAFSKFLLEDWYFAWPLLGMSCIALTLVFWRLFLNFEARTNLDLFLPLFHDALTRDGKDGALRLCRGRRDLIPGSLYVAGLETADQGLAAMRRAMAAVIELEILPSLNFLLAPILAIAKVATMLGLLGTVISMIQTFDALGRPDAGTDLTQHAAGIGLALFATALGLTTAIPLVFAHVLFRAWVTRFEVQLKSAAQKLLVVMQAHEHERRVGDVSPPMRKTCEANAMPQAALVI